MLVSSLAQPAVPAGRVLIADDERDIRSTLALLMRRSGLEAVEAADGRSALLALEAELPDVMILDWRLPDLDGIQVLERARAIDEDLPVILLTAHAHVRVAVEAMRAGAHDYLSKPFEHHEVIRAVLRALSERGLKRQIRNLSGRLASAGESRHPLRELMGPGDAVSRLIEDVQRVARSNFSVIISGETGSGKEAVARAIHHGSSRSGGPFIPVDCGAIPDTLIESELFGHEKGAFTGALHQKAGKFEAADSGTLMLDEISNLPLGAQAKLLRALQERTFYRVGGSASLSVDTRILAVSNHDLDQLSQAGQFRRDLFFRLNEFVIRVPALRDRREDIPYLAKRFLDITNAELGKQVAGFTPGALERLLAFSWPGNVRQLRSTIRRAVLLAGASVEERHLDLSPAGATAASPSETKAPAPALPFPEQSLSDESLPLREIVRRSTTRVEREALARTLEQTGGNKARAARLLDIDYKTISSKVKEYGLDSKGGFGNVSQSGRQAAARRV